jgi:hypothetical protein
MKFKVVFLIVALISLFACENATGPNVLGGDSNLELTKVGNEVGISIKLDGVTSSINGIRDSVYITKNENGIITLKGKFLTDADVLKSIDTMLGTQNLSEDVKHQIVDTYLAKYGATIDTSDKQNMSMEFEMKLKITSEGVQDFLYSNGNVSKPFTIVKYSSNVGDKYEFTTDEGKKIVRTVVQKDPEEDWQLVFWRVKTIRVEQSMDDDPIFKKVTFIGNHKFGLVGAIHELKNGTIITTTITPWAVI